ncbi:MAG: methylated-DNA--[protein]-cysteine S-methyltransferase [Sedimentisphaerales bacterium]|nr:methylated-DNA--[protein]-cysteine S-methyltransferase [Sedimentisphaerales bacterium]
MNYVIFKTKWGHFGLAGTEQGLCRTFLPVAEPDLIKACFLREFPQAKFDKNLFQNLQKQIIAYFEGENVVFNTDNAVFLNGYSEFAKSILNTCQKIKFGQTATYKELAQKAGYPQASRAVGNVLARNPIPLIIPCHRIIQSDGKLGGFTAIGGKNLKKRLLKHEANTLKY